MTWDYAPEWHSWEQETERWMIKPLAALYSAETKEGWRQFLGRPVNIRKYILEGLKEDQGYGVHICFHGTQPIFPGKQKHSGKRSTLSTKEAIKGENFLNLSSCLPLRFPKKLLLKSTQNLCLERGYRRRKTTIAGCVTFCFSFSPFRDFYLEYLVFFKWHSVSYVVFEK